LPDNYAVWFPHLNNTNRDWINTLSGSKTEITEQKKDGSFTELELADRINPPRIIRFAFAYDNWGNDTWGYKFVGAFEPDPEKSDGNRITYKRISEGNHGCVLFFDNEQHFDIKPISTDSPKSIE
jgi:hypothetical protein